MTKPELHNKHTFIAKPEIIALIRDIGAYLRLGTPLAPPNVAIDEPTAIRRSGWLDGWLAATNMMESIHMPEKTPTELTQNKPYAQPQNTVPAEDRPKVPTPEMPSFIQPVK